MTTAVGIDLGTSGIRAALIDAAAKVLALGTVPIPPSERRDPQAWWKATREVLGVLRAGRTLSDVRAIAVDGTSGTVLPVDEDGEPLAAASLYNDRADDAALRALAEIADVDSAARGATSPLARLRRWRELRPARVVHEADWLASRLLGHPAPADENNALKTGYDPRLGDWPEWALDFALGALPDVVPAGTVLGLVGAETVGWGLPRSTRVVAGTTDGCAAFLATGAGPGEGVTSLGTTLTLKILSDAPIYAPAHGIYSHKLRGQWLAGGASNTGGAALQRHFTVAQLIELSARIDPSRDSPFEYYPLPAPGERFPVADDRLPPRETPRPPEDERFLHGLLQGIARIEVSGYRRLAELGAPAPSAVRSVGGGAANVAWTAIRGRLLGVPMRAAQSEDCAVGTAMLALGALVTPA